MTGSQVQLRLFLTIQLILTCSCCKGSSGILGCGPRQRHGREGKGRATSWRKQELADADAYHRRQRGYSPNPTAGRTEASHAYKCVRVDLDLPLPPLQRTQAAGRKSLCSDHTPKPTPAMWKWYVRTHTRHRVETALGKNCDQNRTSKLPLWSADLNCEEMQYAGVSQSTEVPRTLAAPKIIP